MVGGGGEGGGKNPKKEKLGAERKKLAKDAGGSEKESAQENTVKSLLQILNVITITNK